MPKLTLERAREIFDYDPLTGVLRWRVSIGHRGKLGSSAGWEQGNGYLRISASGERLYVHRLAWFLVTGSWPEKEIHHINGIRLDNRIANLRAASRTLNAQNLQGRGKRNTSGFLGGSLFRRDDTFKAQIVVRGKNRHIGYYKTPAAAHAAYLEAKRRLHSGNTL